MQLRKRIAKQKRRRTFRVRNRVRKSLAGRLRLSVYRSNKNIFAQIIDDDAGHTLVAASTAEESICPKGASGGNSDAAVKVGMAIAERAEKKGIVQVSFDRGQYRFHGRVRALANAARERGLSF